MCEVTLQVAIHVERGTVFLASYWYFYYVIFGTNIEGSNMNFKLWFAFFTTLLWLCQLRPRKKKMTFSEKNSSIKETCLLYVIPIDWFSLIDLMRTSSIYRLSQFWNYYLIKNVIHFYNIWYRSRLGGSMMIRGPSCSRRLLDHSSDGQRFKSQRALNHHK